VKSGDKSADLVLKVIMATLLANNTSLTIYGDDRVSALNFQNERMFHWKNSTSSPKQAIQSSGDPYLGLIRFCAALSSDGKLYAVADDRSLIILSTSNWTRKSIKTMKRAASKMIFSPSNDKILVADKTGDVYMFSISDDETEKGILLLGHLSILLDICMTDDEKYIITCDRDEKVRVSCYPNAYNIKCFCLGHSAFVTRILILRDNILLSSSGDGSLKLWNLHTGKNLATYSVNRDVENISQCVITNVSVTNIARENIVCVSIHGFDGILVYKCDSNLNITLIQKLPCNEPLDFTVSGTLLWILNCSKSILLQAFVWNENSKIFCNDIPSSVVSAIDLVRSECSYLSNYSHVDLTILNKKLDLKEKSIEKVKKFKSN
jgi:WD40 repeat protein